MEHNKRIFISYARSDGEVFATILYKKLIEEAFSKDTIWRDREEMEGGRSWWKQIEEALNTVQFMILVATPNAMKSDTVKDELRLARINGVCVCPIQDPAQPVVFSELPQWIRNLHFYDIDKEWKTFVNYLNDSCDISRVPFMARRSEETIIRTKLIQNILKKLVDKSGNAISTTISLVGTAGFGKTTLSQHLCVLDEISDAFFDGILWVSLGQKPDIMKEIRKIYKALTNKDEVFIDEDEGARYLSEALNKKRCLIIIDDVWRYDDLMPFLRKSENYKSAVVITSRSHFMGEGIPVLEMDEEDAIQLLRYDMEGVSDQKLRDFAKQLGHWAIMLKITHSTMREYKRKRQKTSQEALDYINKKIKKGGVTSINPDDISNLLKPSLDLLEDNARQRLFELSILVGDIPISSISLLWGIDDVQTDDQLLEFSKLSLIKSSRYDLIIIHKVIREYLARQLTDTSTLHQRFLDEYGIKHWYDLPQDGTGPYLWYNIAYHMQEAGRITDLYPLITDFRWLQAKLNATKDTSTLIADCDLYLNDNPEDQTVGLIRSALSNAAHILDVNHSTLAHQLAGRLFHHKEIPDIRGFLETVQPPQGMLLYPVDNGYDALTPAGGMLLRILQRHENEVLGVIQLEDGRILSWDESHLCLWDDDGRLSNTATGEMRITDVGRVKIEADSLRVYDDDGTLKEQYPPVQMTEIILSDGRRISWSEETLYVHYRDGSQKSLSGHTDDIKGVLALSNGQFLSWSLDSTLRLWNIDAENIQILREHQFPIKDVKNLANGNFVSWESSKMFLWNADGQPIPMQSEDIGEIKSLHQLNDEFFISSSNDKIYLWNVDGNLQKTIDGFTDAIKDFLPLKNGYIVSWGGGNNLLLWDPNAEEFNLLVQHNKKVRGILSLSNDRFLSWSEDATLCLWNIAGQPIKVLEEHTQGVQGALHLSDGRILSWSDDSTLRLWDNEGYPISILDKHTSPVHWATELPDGRIVSRSKNDTILWKSEGSLLAFFDNEKVIYINIYGNKVWEQKDKSHSLKWAEQQGFDGEILYNTQNQISEYTFQDKAIYKSTNPVFYGDARFTALAFSGDIIVAGDSAGRVMFLRWMK